MDDAPTEPERHRYVVASAEAGVRLDRWLADAAGVARAAARRAIDQRRVRVDGSVAAAGLAVRAGQAVEVRGAIDDRAEPPAAWAGSGLTVLGEGLGWVAIDKPAGLAVHPLDATQRRTALNAVVARRPTIVGVGEGGLRSGVVHRLDVATSGAMLFATDEGRWREFREAFSRHTARKRYVALVHGEGGLPCGDIALRLAVKRHRPARVGVVESGEAGSACSLAARVVERREGFARVEVDLHTGFLHQVRVMLAHLGRPVVGDAVYGPDPACGERLMLHAERLAIGAIDIVSPVPFGWDDVIEAG
ncbi:MAG: RNA pseudouridine synthase [Planctomycetota bacterium]